MGRDNYFLFCEIESFIDVEDYIVNILVFSFFLNVIFLNLLFFLIGGLFGILLSLNILWMVIDNVSWILVMLFSGIGNNIFIVDCGVYIGLVFCILEIMIVIIDGLIVR